MRFGEGFVSYPITWWAAHIQTLALTGTFGEAQLANAQLRQNTLAAIIWRALQDLDKTLCIIQYYGGRKLDRDKAGVAGRLAGGIFTNQTIGRGISGKGARTKKVALSVANYALASFGAAIYAIAKGATKFEDLLGVILAGDYNIHRCITPEDIDRMPRRCGKAEDYEMELEVLREVERLNEQHRNNFKPMNEENW